MTDNPPLPRYSIPADNRRLLRSAITSNEGWKAFAARKGISAADLTSELLIEAALEFGINLDEYGTLKRNQWGARGGYAPRPRVHGAAEIDALQIRFSGLSASGVMSDKDREFCADVFATIRTKQAGEATAGQFAAISRTLAKYEGQNAEQSANHETHNANNEGNNAMNAQTNNAMFANAAAANTGDIAGQLAGIISALTANAVNPAQIAAIVDAKIQEAFASVPSFKIELKDTSGEVRSYEGLQHKTFKTLVRMAAARQSNGFPLNIWLAGPAGSGKTHAGQELAKLMGLQFYGMGAKSTAFEVLGYQDAAGTYHGTPFRTAFEHGGILQADELDSWDNEACLALQSALANDFCQFPDAIVKRHPACHCIAGANTWGHGATADYVGRTKIDGAFLSRFVKLRWDYDNELETALSGNPKFARRVQRAREKAQAAGLKVLITPRDTMAGAALIAAGFNDDEAADLTYLASLSSDQKAMLA